MKDFPIPCDCGRQDKVLQAVKTLLKDHKNNAENAYGEALDRTISPEWRDEPPEKFKDTCSFWHCVADYISATYME